MGGKVKSTTLTKTGHVYVLQHNEQQWRLKLQDNGSLLIETGGPTISIVGYGSGVAMNQVNVPVQRKA